jgi:hypothetical protein
MKSQLIAATALAAALFVGVPDAFAAKSCVTKGAIATSGTVDSAKWYALETMVQSVSWSLWPGYVATSKVDGYNVINEKYSCKPDGGLTTCRGSATFCKK